MGNEYRQLVGLPRGNNKVFLAWRMLKKDKMQTSYVVQRRRKKEDWETVSENIKNSTNYMDKTPTGDIFEYRVLKDSSPKNCSEVIEVDSGSKKSNTHFRMKLPFSFDNWGRKVVMGDLENDGRIGFVTNFFKNDQIWLMAINAKGKELWKVNTSLPASGGWDGNPHHVPFFCWDIDNDGRTEVVFHHGGEVWSEKDDFYDKGRSGELLVIADGQTGEIKKTTSWPAVKPRVMMTVGHLRGRDQPAAAVILDETYGDVTITAIDGASTDILWQKNQERPAGHNLDVADINNDNIQEVIVGGICYNGDGSQLWQAEPFGHTDMSKPANIDPERPGLEVFYMVESHNPGVYLVDYEGNTIFKEEYAHAHFGWLAKHTVEYKGLQMQASEDKRHGNNKEHHPVFLRDGTHWINLTDYQSKNLMPVQWDEGLETVFIHRKHKKIVSLDKEGELHSVPQGELPEKGRYGRNILLADIVGDFRENIVTVDKENNELVVITNPAIAETKKLSPKEKFYYRHDRSQHGSGYYMYTPPHDLG
ncbi:MAG: hypothetical protein ACOCV3_04980 [Halanaerobiales bacterium]